ncbi:acylneuraminate cytidylyltransferase family protein [Amylibacter sp.]|nr:acylneuraminate cytidylyltransferase family protein [Amylibacter sp.]
MKNFLFVIPARGGSKGVKKKNMKLLAGKPLFWHISEKALQVKNIYSEGNIDIVVSSDDHEIIKSANELSPELAPFTRPDELANDNSESIFTVIHALNWMEKKHEKQYDYISLLQPTSPLIEANDILNVLNEIDNDTYFNSWTTITQSFIHPFKMKRLADSGEIFNYIDQGFEDMRPRQILPPVYKRSGAIYITKRDIGVNNESIINDPCFGLELPYERAIDIDTLMDFDQVKLILKEKENAKS